MGARIHKLSENLIRKIAAGEVIERPASVVKELVENSLDAGARRIHVDIDEGGRQGICVSDDGHGMTPADVDVCAERHATSKMHSPTDLFTVDTLGFRGEALASIGAVSRMTIEARAREGEEGTRLVIEGGIRRAFGAVARDVGTSIDVRNLFFNTPARRKFLRQVETEARYVTQSIVSLAAGYPAVAFQLTHSGRTTLQMLPSDRHQRAAELLNIPADELLWVEGETAGIRIQALLSPPSRCRRTRTKQFVIVRERPVSARALQRAVYTGYGSLLPHNRHPIYVMWVDLDPRQLDVNVHPTKREVRFADERLVREAVEAAVRDTLKMPETGSPRPAAKQARSRPHGDWRSGDRIPEIIAEPTGGWAPGEEAPSDAPWAPGRVPAGLTGDEETQISLDLVATSRLRGRPVAGGPEDAQWLGQARQSAKVWQFHDKYLLVVIADGLLVIDQHAAHERVRFEEVLDALEREPVGTQSLLMPLPVEVNPVEMAAYRQARDLFERLGFEIREFGRSTLLVEGLPSELRTWSEGDLFYQLLSDFAEELEVRSEPREALAATMACHSSIRAGRRLGGEEISALVERLLRTREPFACPHGRPIFVRLPLQEFDRLFGR